LCPNTHFTQVKDVRWWLFKTKQAQSESSTNTICNLHKKNTKKRGSFGVQQNELKNEKIAEKECVNIE
jgi:hypothetical protein